MSLKLRKLSYPLGAEIMGVDIARPLDEQPLLEVRRAFLDHCLLLFRGQPITSAQFVAFGRQFGRPDTTRRNRNPEYPDITHVINKPKPEGGPLDGHYAGADWHSDESFKVAPTGIGILRGVAIPEIGGDTQFANMYLAYETLSEGMKKLIEGLAGVHIQEERVLDHSSPERLMEARRSMTVAQPLVKVHPETGRKALYIGDKVQLFTGMTAEESRPLIDVLCAHARRPQFVYCHQWQKDDILMWDNRCANHNALGNYDRRNQLRSMEKLSLVGPVTGKLYDDPTQTRNLTRTFAYA